MATIKIYRSETQRVTPQTQALGLRAPDLGIVGRAVSQFGQALGVAGEERAKLAAATKASQQHKLYQAEIQNIERNARRMNPADSEDYYLREAEASYKRHYGNLPTSYAKSLFAKPAGETSFSSRAKFFKENDGRLVAAGIAASDEEALNYSRRASDITRPAADRAGSLKRMGGQITEQEQRGWITPKEAGKRRVALAMDTVRNIMRQRMANTDTPTDVVDELRDGNIADPILRYLVNEELSGTDLNTIIRQEHATAKQIETVRRLEVEAAEDKANDEDESLKKLVFNATRHNVAQAVAVHEDLLDRDVYTYNERKNAETTLGLLGVSKYMDNAAGITPNSWRSPGDQDDFSATMQLGQDDHNNELSMKTIVQFAKDGKLTREGFDRWRLAVATEKREIVENAIKIFGDRFQYERYQNSEGMDRELTQAAMRSASAKLREWVRDNPTAEAPQIREHSKKLLKDEYADFIPVLQDQLAEDVGSRSWGLVLADEGQPDLLKRATTYLATAKRKDDDRGQDMARDVIRMLRFYKTFGVIK